MDPNQALNKLGDIAVSLLMKDPFYGHVLACISRSVTEEDTKEITSLTSFGLNSVKLLVNLNKFKEEKSDINLILRLKHELIHYIFMHPWADRPKDVGLFYLSCDLSVNTLLQGKDTNLRSLHDKFSLNSNNFTNLFSKYKVNLNLDGWDEIYRSFQELIDKIDKVSSLNDKLKWQELALQGKFTEPVTTDPPPDFLQYCEPYFYLPKNPSGNTNLGKMGPEVASMMKGGSSQEEIEEAIQDMMNENSDPWGEIKEGTSDLSAKKNIMSAVKDAQSRANGNIPAGLENYINALFEPPKIDWRREVRLFYSFSGNVTASSTMSRRSKRYGTFPSFRVRKTKRFAVLCDSSGSVSDEEFVAFFAELKGLLDENTEVILVQADADVDQVDIYTRRLPDKMSINRNGYGGTAFGPALNYVRTEGRSHPGYPQIGPVDGVIYMTDGYAPAPDSSNYPRCKTMWLTTQKPVHDMINEGFQGKIVKLDLD